MGRDLSNSDKKKIVAWLDEKWPGHKCDVCGTNEWALADHLVVPPVYSVGSFMVGGPSYPQAVCVCRNCAQTKFFNAVVIGGLEALEEPPKEEKEGGGNG